MDSPLLVVFKQNWGNFGDVNEFESCIAWRLDKIVIKPEL